MKYLPVKTPSHDSPNRASSGRLNHLRALIATAALSLVSHSAFAERYALLVGVSDYRIKPLSGPVNDVSAMKQVLNQKWGFKLKNIAVILDEEATKDNILRAIEDLYKRTRDSDDVFIYLSGHGTSANDRDMRIPLPTTSGAFIPIDITNAKTPQQIVDRLIIGRRDLQPLFVKFDKGNRNVFVAIDACYSGNTVRGFFKGNKLPNRNLSMSELLPARAFGDDLAQKTTTDWKKAEEHEYNTYPYKNIFYLSASGEHEPAQDIPAELVRVYPTIDGKPHGAFSDTLIRVLSRDIDADINEDGEVTYIELKNIVRNMMRTRGFDHTPQGLPTLAEDQNHLAARSLFGNNNRGLARVIDNNKKLPENQTQIASLDTPPLPANPNLLYVKIDPQLTDIQKMIASLDTVRLANDNHAIEIRRNNNEIIAVSASGDLISKIPGETPDAVKRFIERQAWVHKLVNRPMTQGFNLEVELHGPGRGSTAVRGEDIGFSVRSAERAYILLVDIDSQGTINVIYPYHESELNAVAKNQTLQLKNISTVTPPFGRDFIQVYAFSELSDELKELRGQSFSENSPLAVKFESLIQSRKGKVARADMELVTSDIGP